MYIIFLIKLLIIIIFSYCASINAKEKRIIIASTTSTYDSGLLNNINKKFEEEFKIKVHVLALGTGQAIEVAKKGNAEILLVHHTPSEIKFMNEGYGLERYNLMYNDYILVGPKNDTKGCKSIYKKFIHIYENKKLFISRGDDSGTNKKEIELWQNSKLNFNEFKNWYIKIGQGMGATLLMTNEKNAYTLTDRATWISFNKKDNLKIICENNPPLFNQYGIILVNSNNNKNLNIIDASIYIKWIISDKGKEIINNFKYKNLQLFFFNHH